MRHNIPAHRHHVLALKMMRGMVVKSTNNPSLDGIYSLNDLTMLGNIARDVATGIGLPKGRDLIDYPDIKGFDHFFRGSEIVHLYKEMRDLVLELQKQDKILQSSGVPFWPMMSVVID